MAGVIRSTNRARTLQTGEYLTGGGNTSNLSLQARNLTSPRLPPPAVEETEHSYQEVNVVGVLGPSSQHRRPISSLSDTLLEPLNDGLRRPATLPRSRQPTIYERVNPITTEMENPYTIPIQHCVGKIEIASLVVVSYGEILF